MQVILNFAYSPDTNGYCKFPPRLDSVDIRYVHDGNQEYASAITDACIKAAKKGNRDGWQGEIWVASRARGYSIMSFAKVRNVRKKTMEEIKRTIRCDMCGKEIKMSPFMKFLMGDRYFVRTGIFGWKLKIDLCHECINTLKDIRRNEEGIGGVE